MEVYDAINQTWVEKARTEVLKDNPNPDFTTQLKMDYCFEEKQILRFQVFDSDGSSGSLIGDIEVTLGELITSSGKTKTGCLYKKNAPMDCSISFRCEEICDLKELLVLRLRGEGLDKKDLLSKSDPFFEIHRLQADGTSFMVFTSEVIQNTLNPAWEQRRISIQQLCNNDYNKHILLKVFDHDKDSTPEIIGEVKFTIAEITRSMGIKLQLLSPKGKAAGQVSVEHASVVRDSTFIDYLRGGCQINLIVAIDLTGSNGNPREPGTLHYRSADTKNPYQRAIVHMAEILSPYDSDGKFVLWGFVCLRKFEFLM